VVLVVLTERFPVKNHQFSRSMGEVASLMVRKGKAEKMEDAGEQRLA
jgi:hypothetical protein